MSEERDPVVQAARVLERALLRGPVPCRVIGEVAQANGIGPVLQSRARRRLGLEVIRGEDDGRPYYRLPVIPTV